MDTNGITMVIRSLMGGGAERVMTDMANYWVERGKQITIITTVPVSTDAYPLDSRVGRVVIPGNNACMFPWRVDRLRQEIVAARNGVVLSFMDRSNVPVIAACKGLAVKTIVAEHIDPATQNYPCARRMAVKLAYPHADAVTVLTENVKRDWADRFVPPHKVHVLHNPVLELDRSAPLPSWLPEKYFCCMGRLHPQKGFDRLFDSLPGIFDRWPEHHLVILGEGADREALEQQADRLGVADKIHMPGFVPSPHSIMAAADLFLFPSRYEGFGNALLEAMSLGLPSVSFDCPSGPALMIQHGENGLLLPEGDMKAFTESVHWMMEHPQERRAMGEKARGIRAKCHIDRVMAAWDRLVSQVCEERAATPVLAWREEAQAV